MRFAALMLTLSLALALPAAAADYAREKKWADEVLPSVLTGDPVWLELADGRKYLSLYTEAANAKAGVIVVHGLGVHPDWNLISVLRQQLPEAGYATLSVQMPVLRAEAKGDDYPPTFDEAAERLARAAAFLREKGYQKIVVVSHSLGCRMTDRYLSRNPDAPLAAWAAIGAGVPLDYSGLKFPVLDLIGENDLPQVLKTAPERARTLRGKSAQKVAPKADHFFNGQDALLVDSVRSWLDAVL